MLPEAQPFADRRGSLDPPVPGRVLRGFGRVVDTETADFDVTPRTAVARPFLRGSWPLIAPEIPGLIEMALGDDDPDVAGGTGDISFRFLKRAGHGHATVLDLTEPMLVEGRKRAEAASMAAVDAVTTLIALRPSALASRGESTKSA